MGGWMSEVLGEWVREVNCLYSLLSIKSRVELVNTGNGFHLLLVRIKFIVVSLRAKSR